MSVVELLEKLYEKQEKLADDMAGVKIILAKQEENIRYHILRTEQNEFSIDALRKEMDPVEGHVKAIQTVLKLFGLAGIGATLVSATVQVIRLFSNS